MAWVAVDKDGNEFVYDCKPLRSLHGDWWSLEGIDDNNIGSNIVKLPTGSIAYLLDYWLTWDDEPVELK